MGEACPWAGTPYALAAEPETHAGGGKFTGWRVRQPKVCLMETSLGKGHQFCGASEQHMEYLQNCLTGEAGAFICQLLPPGVLTP